MGWRVKCVGVEGEDMKQVAEVMPCIIVCGEGKNDLQEVTCTEYSSSRVILGTLWRSDEKSICGSQ